MIVAAAETGHGIDLSLMPEGKEGPIAVARLKDGAANPDPLFAHVLARRSCKEPFQDRAVPAASVAQLQDLGAVITDPSMVKTLQALTWEAHQIETKTPHTYAESVELMRFGKAEIEAKPDGIDLGGGMLEVLVAGGLLSKEKLYDLNSTAYAEGVRRYHEMLHATPAYVTLKTAGNTRRDQIEAGRSWLRLNLTTTQLGLALHPVSQALQEYSEMASVYERAHQLLAEPGETVQMLGRLGYGPNVPRTPRWSLEHRMKGSAG